MLDPVRRAWLANYWNALCTYGAQQALTRFVPMAQLVIILCRLISPHQSWRAWRIRSELLDRSFVIFAPLPRTRDLARQRARFWWCMVEGTPYGARSTYPWWMGWLGLLLLCTPYGVLVIIEDSWWARIQVPIVTNMEFLAKTLQVGLYSIIRNMYGV